MSFIGRLGTATDTWLTPQTILNPLGVFDLDPCVAPQPRPWNCAISNYALPAENGLKLPWHGRVWLNPPYDYKTPIWMGRLAAVEQL